MKIRHICTVLADWHIIECSAIASYATVHLWMYFDPLSWNVLERFRYIIESRSLFLEFPEISPKWHLVGGLKELSLFILTGCVITSSIWHLVNICLWKDATFWPITIMLGLLSASMATTLREVSWRGMKESIQVNQLYFSDIGKSLINREDKKGEIILQLYGLSKVQNRKDDRLYLRVHNRPQLGRGPKIHAEGRVVYDQEQESVMFETNLTGVFIAYTPIRIPVLFTPRKLNSQHGENIPWGRLAIVGPEVAVLVTN